MLGCAGVNLFREASVSMSGFQFFKYVPNGFVHVWEAAGWVAVSDLGRASHGIYSTLMKAGPDCQYDEAGEPICPLMEAA